MVLLIFRSCIFFSKRSTLLSKSLTTWPAIGLLDWAASAFSLGRVTVRSSVSFSSPAWMYNCKFINELYDKHIEAFSAGSYNEPGNDEKNSIKKYIDTFEVLIKNIKKSGIDETISVIPVGKNNEIMDGAHRTAIASYFNLF